MELARKSVYSALIRLFSLSVIRNLCFRLPRQTRQQLAFLSDKIRVININERDLSVLIQSIKLPETIRFLQDSKINLAPSATI